MKATQVLYLLLFIGIICLVIRGSQLLDDEGFQSPQSEPILPKVLEPTKLETQASPNPSVPGELPFGPYGQMPSVGSFPYQDPSLLPAELTQMKKLNEDIRSFLVFEGPKLAEMSDPSIQLPLTQLRADSGKLQQEIAVLNKNSGIASQLTQQNLADIEGSLVFLQRRARLFDNSDVLGVEGFTDSSSNTKATKEDLQKLQAKTYAAILVLSSTGTTNPVVQQRIKLLQKMYADVTSWLQKLDKGEWTTKDIPVDAAYITKILPSLADPKSNISSTSTKSTNKLNQIEKEIAKLVGDDEASSVYKKIKENGMFRVSVDLGYNVNSPTLNRTYGLNSNGAMDTTSSSSDTPVKMDLPFDTKLPGMDDRASMNPAGSSSNKTDVGRFDWKKRANFICDQVKARGMNPEDFGCIAANSLMSPAYSWRGHTKMICGRLQATMDPGLPVSCGCPPASWKGWTLSV
jgi:hypothetical protein